VLYGLRHKNGIDFNSTTVGRRTIFQVPKRITGEGFFFVAFCWFFLYAQRAARDGGSRGCRWDGGGFGLLHGEVRSRAAKRV